MQNYTATCLDGGRYTLTADEGYMMQRTDGNGTPAKQVTTRYYIEWQAVPAPAEATKPAKKPAAKKAKKAE